MDGWMDGCMYVCECEHFYARYTFDFIFLFHPHFRYTSLFFHSKYQHFNYLSIFSGYAVRGFYGPHICGDALDICGNKCYCYI